MGTQIKVRDMRKCQYLDSAQPIVLFFSPLENIYPFPLFSTLHLQFGHVNHLIGVLIAKVLPADPPWYPFWLLTTASHMRQLRSRLRQRVRKTGWTN